MRPVLPSCFSPAISMLTSWEAPSPSRRFAPSRTAMTRRTDLASVARCKTHDVEQRKSATLPLPPSAPMKERTASSSPAQSHRVRDTAFRETVDICPAGPPKSFHPPPRRFRSHRPSRSPSARAFARSLAPIVIGSPGCSRRNTFARRRPTMPDPPTIRTGLCVFAGMMNGLLVGIMTSKCEFASRIP